MKRIVICFDGTWNKPANEALPDEKRVETSVRRFYNSVKEAAGGARQVKWYDQGVGSQWHNRFLGGAIGAGLERNILQGCEFLAEYYKGEFTDSYAKFLRGLYAKRNARHYRAIGATKFGKEAVDESVQLRRREDREYEPQNDGLPPRP